MVETITFITGNENKFSEFSQIMSERLPEQKFKRIDIDLPEIQGTIDEVAFAKCKAAFSLVEGPFIVEDTSLLMDAYGSDLPGPYIKWFLKSLGPSGLCKMLSGFEDRGAKAICTIVYCDGKNLDNCKMFKGITTGYIKKSPAAGSKSFGWDPIFQPLGYEESYSEMSGELKNSISHRSKAIDLFINHFK